MATPHVSEKVLNEILRSFIHAESLPSEDALNELALAAGRSPRDVMRAYTRLYGEEGHQGDPWPLPDG